MYLEKTIRSLKLSITSECNINCEYCFVDKSKKEMSVRTAENAVDLLMESKGGRKVLKIFGGEPFLRPEFLKHVVNYAREKEAESSKKLYITVCTNLTVIDKDLLVFLDDKNVGLNFSIADKNTHDQRRSYNGKCSFEEVLENYEIAKKVLGKYSVGCSICVFPENVSKMFETLKLLNSKGVNYFSFEIIRGDFEWREKHKTIFEEQLRKVLQFVLGKYREKEYLFLKLLNEFIILDEEMEKCPFVKNLNVDSEGRMAFSPFLYGDKGKVVADLSEGKSFRYENCGPGDEKCGDCFENYFDGSKTMVDRIQHSYINLIRSFLIMMTDHRAYFKDYRDKIIFEGVLN